ncbi:MAG: hypothetical protein Q8O03_03295 [Nanoarchaeota archaeon]|nr:hypothetical protein [Nanoarchaeota archaeon]
MDKVKMLKKGGLLALGLASITTKKAEGMINSLLKEGKLNQKQGETLARKVIAETLREQQRIRKQVIGEVAKSACRIISVTKQEAGRLMKQVKPVKAQPKKAKKKR